MKNLLKTMAAGVLVTLAACTNDDNAPAADYVSHRAQEALLAKYPGASNIRWRSKGNYVIATFSTPATATRTASDSLSNTGWFDNSGEWYMTETDIPKETLPAPVQQAFEKTEYSQEPWWITSYADQLDRGTGVETVYVIEARKEEGTGAQTQVHLYYAADGVLIKKVAGAGNDYDYEDYIPSKPSTGIEDYIRNKHPGARITDVDYEHGMTEVELIDVQGNECFCRELLFDSSGAWQYTKTEVRYDQVPQQVLTALKGSKYSAYWIDDIDYFDTPQGKFYRFELESADDEDVKVDITPEGTVTEARPQPGQGNGQMVAQEVKEFINTKYPGALILEYDWEDGLLEVEIRHKEINIEKEVKKKVLFNGANAWVCTEWDVRRSELPQAVKDAIAKSQWATYEIDDIEYVQTPQVEYYLIELESGKQEKELRVKADGMIL